MSEEQSTNLAGTEPDEDAGGNLLAKPKIKILLYTDNPITTMAKVGNFSDFSLGQMIEHVNAHQPSFAEISFELVCRNFKGAHKLDDMIDQYHQIWFFGFNQSEGKNSNPSILRSGHRSELDDDEILKLKNWMRVDGHGGGVLMTGDHSEPMSADAVMTDIEPDADDVSPADFLGLGRAIGRRVPRAGRMRVWRGKPTNDPKDSFNTDVTVNGINPDSLELQIDPVPQQLVLRHFNDQGVPTPNGQPHPLFWYPGGRWIRVFPDHAHEGALATLKDSEFDDKKMWPQVGKVQPKPQAVAFGIDERHYRLRPIISAYDGDLAQVGRIVADSTWHHYFNINLTNLRSPAPDGSAADQIGQYYANLAIWLSPLHMRQQMVAAMFQSLTVHPSIREEFGNDPLVIGRAAYSLLQRAASPCEIYELIHAVVPDNYHQPFESLYFAERGVPMSIFPSLEMILGCIISRHQQETIRIASADEMLEHLDVADVLDTGFRAAFQNQAALLKEMAATAQDLANTN